MITVLPWTLRADVIENSFVALHFPRPNIRLGVGLVDPNLACVDECDAHEITSTTTLRQIKKFVHKRQIFNIVRHRIIRLYDLEELARLSHTTKIYAVTSCALPFPVCDFSLLLSGSNCQSTAKEGVCAGSHSTFPFPSPIVSDFPVEGAAMSCPRCHYQNGQRRSHEPA